MTSIQVGEVIERVNPGAPECLDEPHWPCLYFRFTAPYSGALDLSLSYALGTQGGQAVDMTLSEADSRRYVWAQTFRNRETRQEVLLTTQVVEGRTYDITLWYTFPNLEYELRSSLRAP